MPLNSTLEVLMLEFPVSRTGRARQKCICKGMKYWVCFDYELALTSLASCELAEILMRWDSFLFIRVLLVCHISGLQQINCLGKKGSPVSYKLAWTHPAMCSISACLQWRDADGRSTFPTLFGVYTRKLAKRSVLKYLSIMAWHKCGEFTPPQCSVVWMPYPTGSILRNLIGKHHL